MRILPPRVPKPTKTVAIVVPMHNRPQLLPEEEVSLRHLIHYLGKYDKYLLVPETPNARYHGFGIKRFSKKFFGSTDAYRRLMLTAQFYDTFREYKYILIYHLDALVFSDQLMEWCETDLDYIGPPFISCADSPWVKVERVGNGGLSLRKIDTFLKTIYSSRYYMEPNEYWRKYCASKPRVVQYLNLPRKYLKRLGMANCAQWHMSHWTRNEDLFWSDMAVKYNPEFKIASLDTGLRFAFEAAPRLCFERNNFRLPFGCHGWPRYDRDFWDPFLLK